MIKAYSFDEIKRFESFCISELDYKSILLMENAANYSIDAMIDFYSIELGKSSFTILAGSGNNGGDTIAIARKLAIRGAFRIELILVDEGKTAERVYQEKLLCNCNFPNVSIHSYTNIKKTKNTVLKADFFIDGLLGIGVKGKLKKEYEEIVDTINLFMKSNEGKGIKKIAIDVPSGLASDYDNKVIETDLVVILGFLKTELFLPENRKKWKEYVLISIDFPSMEQYNEKIKINSNAEIIEYNKEISIIPKRSDFSNKSSYKRCCIIGNSPDYFGAIATAAQTAMTSGSGYTYLLMPESQVNAFKIALHNVIVFPYKDADNSNDEKKTCFSIDKKYHKIFDNTEIYLVGTGFGHDSSMFFSILSFILPFAKTIIIDAEGIREIASNIDVFKKLVEHAEVEFIFTPHPGEFEELKNRMGYASLHTIDAAQKIEKEIKNCSICLKDFITFFLVENNMFFNNGCYGGYAKAGTGDFFAGLITGLSCLGISSKDAVIASIAVMDGISLKLKQKGISKHAVSTTLIIETLPYILP